MSIVNKVKSKPYKSSNVHMFNIKIPIVQKVLDIYTPEETETLANYIVNLGALKFVSSFEAHEMMSKTFLHNLSTR